MDLVYKFFSDESTYALSNLENGQISFSSLETLNDPFEGIGVYLYEVSDDEKAYWDSRGLNLPQLLSQRVSEEIREEANFNYRVFCATKEFDNPAMWAYYANEHKGFCVGYSKNEIMSLSAAAKDIIYIDELYHINDPDESRIMELLFRKSTAWQQEKEYRALYRLKKHDVDCVPIDEYFSECRDKNCIYTMCGHAQTNNLRCFRSNKYIIKTCKPAVIYCGLFTPAEVRSNLLEIAHKYDIPIFQMTLEQNRLQLTPREIRYNISFAN